MGSKTTSRSRINKNSKRKRGNSSRGISFQTCKEAPYNLKYSIEGSPELQRDFKDYSPIINLCKNEFDEALVKSVWSIYVASQSVGKKRVWKIYAGTLREYVKECRSKGLEINIELISEATKFLESHDLKSIINENTSYIR